MKARLTTVFAAAVGALALATGALAAPHQNGVKGWDYMGPAASTGWTSYDPFAHADPCASRCASAAKPNPWGSRGSLRPNPTGARGSVHGW